MRRPSWCATGLEASGARLGHRRAVGPQRRRSCRTSRERLARAVGLPYVAAVERARRRPPQREMANSQQQVANVRGAFASADPLPDGPCLLVDDLRFSGWTLAMLAGQLRRHGVPAVYPLALATAF